MDTDIGINFDSSFRATMRRLGFTESVVVQVLAALSVDQHVQMKNGGMAAYAYYLSNRKNPFDHLRELNSDLLFIGESPTAKTNRIGLLRYIRYLESLHAARPKTTD